MGLELPTFQLLGKPLSHLNYFYVCLFVLSFQLSQQGVENEKGASFKRKLLLADGQNDATMMRGSMPLSRLCGKYRAVAT